ncbi:hypothetical protein ONZ51_g7440 [Trametes cubensis]|uniref:Uncharacterized protein n=1 Tax=Trametes cubensis TaxID=1111947 RepID=A0AAD7TSP7_9APHY|nr:hypothetical protein ONZ51_g7440 [Trametes cubensis]
MYATRNFVGPRPKCQIGQEVGNHGMGVRTTTLAEQEAVVAAVRLLYGLRGAANEENEFIQGSSKSGSPLSGWWLVWEINDIPAKRWSALKVMKSIPVPPSPLPHHVQLLANGSYQALWISGCQEKFGGNRADNLAHLEHHYSADALLSTHKVPCIWGCGKSFYFNTMNEHIAYQHLGFKYHCPLKEATACPRSSDIADNLSEGH